MFDKNKIYIPIGFKNFNSTRSHKYFFMAKIKKAFVNQ